MAAAEPVATKALLVAATPTGVPLRGLKAQLSGQYSTIFDLYGRPFDCHAPEMLHYTDKGFSVDKPTVAVTGTAIAGGVTEAQIVTGGETLILTLTNGTWAAAGTVFDALRQSFLNGLTSSSSGANSFATAVAAICAVTDVVRTSSTVVTITLDAAASYGIVADDTVTITIPALAVVNSNSATLQGPLTPVTAPTFVVTAGVPTIAMTGTIVAGGVLESQIVTGGETAILTITGGVWATAGANFNGFRQAIISGFDGNHAEAHSWDTDIKAAAAVTTVVRTSNAAATFTTPAAATYSITTTNEIVTVVVPAGAVVHSVSGAAYGALVTNPTTFTITEGS